MQDTLPDPGGRLYEQPGTAAAAAALLTFRDSRALSFSVWNSAAVTSRATVEQLPLGADLDRLVLFRPENLIGLPFSDGARPPYCALVPSNSEPTGFDEVA